MLDLTPTEEPANWWLWLPITRQWCRISARAAAYWALHGPWPVALAETFPDWRPEQ